MGRKLGPALARREGGPYIPAVRPLPATPDHDDPALALLTLLPGTARGPKREGIFALWLTLRVALDLLDEPPLAERAHRRRLLALEHRLSSLTLPPPLRRALTAALGHLREARPETAVLVLSQLAAPARDHAGADAGEALARAARRARAELAGQPS
jgi:hypothetical protein